MIGDVLTGPATETQALYLDALAERLDELHAETLALPRHPVLARVRRTIHNHRRKALTLAAVIRDPRPIPSARVVADFIQAFDGHRSTTRQLLDTLNKKANDA